jgi:hypothetical protein
VLEAEVEDSPPETACLVDRAPPARSAGALLINTSRGGSGTSPSNAEWVKMMEEVGLKPFEVDRNGKRTGRQRGQKLRRDIVEGGPFDRAFQTMPQEYKPPWFSLPLDQQKAPAGGNKGAAKKIRLTYRCGRGTSCPPASIT